ncbi:MAG: nucleotide exchange factor GrpE [Myxococcaceae bacterium]|nr:nucleotide exchange factor GrpE [Myxococcaceae bacterium]
MSDSEKGKFTADISNDVIREALESVKRHTGGGTTDEVEPVDISQTDPAPNPPGEAVAEAEAAAPDPAAADQDAAQKELETLRAQLDFSQAKGRELMEKLKEQHERMLRAAADLENFKKRAQKEKEEIQRFGIEKVLKDFLPVIDNLDRALDHASRTSDLEGLKKGLEMTRKQFEEALGKHGVKGFSSVGQPFDPRLHEAMQQVETTEVPANHVVSEMVRGYMLHDRLIRPALVSVARPPVAAPPPQTENSAEKGGEAEDAASAGETGSEQA